MKRSDSMVSALGSLLDLGVKLYNETRALGSSLAAGIIAAVKDPEARAQIASALHEAVKRATPATPFVKGVRVVKTATVTIGGGRDTDTIVRDQAGKAGVNSDITQECMPTGHWGPRVVVIEFGEFDHDPLTTEIAAWCQELGHGHPTYEDGLRYQEAEPDAQRERPHIFLPENPVRVLNGYPVALDLWDGDGKRRLDLALHAVPDHRWGRGCAFARRKYQS